MTVSPHPDLAEEPVQPAVKPGAAEAISVTKVRNRLFTKYVALFVAVVAVALLSNGIFEVFFYYHEHKAALIRIQREQAEAAAAKISQFIKEIEGQLGWTTQLPWSTSSIEQRRFDALRLLRQVPAITELAQVDSTGTERLRVSRLAMDVVDSGLDLSKDAKFTEAVTNKVYFGPVYFRRESEPYMTLSVAGTRKDAGVSIAEVNLKLIWDVVSQIKVGERGHAYVVGPGGRLIAHPDISLVLRNTDMSKLVQVQAAQAGGAGASADAAALNIQGQEVLTASAPIAPLGWTMFVELPVEEAYASLYQALQRLTIVLLMASLFAVLAGIFLARRMVGPIQALRAGAARIGGGDFTQRISIKTGDELEGLADQFNDMGSRLRESYADLENKVEVRTAELSESLRQQTAVGDVLKIISRSTFDLQPVLDTLVETAARLCDAEMAFIMRREGDVYRAGAAVGYPEAYIQFLKAHPVSVDRRTVTGRTALERRTIQILDVATDPEYTMSESISLAHQHTALGVPLLREDELIGVIILARQRVEAFSPKQIELVTTFADQAVIAIENVRLFDEVRARTDDLSESLEQQTAQSEVLSVISSSQGELQPVFQAMLANAMRICAANFGVMFEYANGQFRGVSSLHLPPAFADYLRESRVWGPDTGLGRIALTRETVHITDVLDDPAYDGRDHNRMASAELGGVRSFVGVPLLREGELIGAFGIFRQEVRPFTDKQIELVTSFANQAVIAIENARLFNEVQAKTRDLSEALVYQTGSANILRVIASSPTDVKPILKAIVESASELCDAMDAAVLLKDGSDLRFSEHHGSIPLGMLKWPINRHWTAGRAFLDQKTVHVHDLLSAEGDEFPDGQELAKRMGLRTILSAPLVRDGESIGAIVLRRAEVRPFSDKQVTLLQTFADQAVIAIGNVRLFEQVQARTKELSQSIEDLRTAQDRLVQTEKLASLGQLTAGIAHEIKNPLNFVNNFSALSSELVDELNDVLKPVALDDKARQEIDELTKMLKGNLEKVVQHGMRADSIVKNMLLHSRDDSGEHRPVDINAIVDESLNLAYHGARAERPGFNITLTRDFDPTAGMIDLYPQEITRVFLNLISNGFYAANKRREISDESFEPMLTASTKVLGDRVEIRIRDNGTGIPPEVKARMFNPFFTTKPAGEGTGLGLSISHDIIVKQHGGTIDVHTEPGAFTEFIITLPRAAAAQAIAGGDR